MAVRTYKEILAPSEMVGKFACPAPRYHFEMASHPVKIVKIAGKRVYFADLPKKWDSAAGRFDYEDFPTDISESELEQKTSYVMLSKDSFSFVCDTVAEAQGVVHASLAHRDLMKKLIEDHERAFVETARKGGFTA